MEEKGRKGISLRKIRYPPSPLNLRIDENTNWSKEEFNLFKHYGGKSVKDQIITLCADLEETALRIQYGFCTEDKDVMSFMPILLHNIEEECKRLLDLIIPINQHLKSLEDK